VLHCIQPFSRHLALMNVHNHTNKQTQWIVIHPSGGTSKSDRLVGIRTLHKTYRMHHNICGVKMTPTSKLLLLGGKLLAQCCRADDLLPSIPISCLPSCDCRMDLKVLRLNIFINCSQPCNSRMFNGSPPVCWWS